MAVSPPPAPEEAKVIESPDALVVMVILEPATSVNVSVAESATTSDWPETDIVLNTESEAADIVTVSVPALVVIVTLSPAARVKVSVAPSETTVLWPETAIFVNALPAAEVSTRSSMIFSSLPLL